MNPSRWSQDDLRGRTIKRLVVRGILVFLAFQAVVGCGTTRQVIALPDQTKVIEEQGKGRIYVIGEPFAPNIALHNTAITVAANEKLVGYIVGHGYLCWERAPGTETIVALPEAEEYLGGHNNSKSSLDLNIESGKIYHVLLRISPDWENILKFPGGTAIRTKLELVTEQVGKEKLRKSKEPTSK